MRRETPPPLFAIAWQHSVTKCLYFLANPGSGRKDKELLDLHSGNARKFSTVADAASWLEDRNLSDDPYLHVVGLLPGWMNTADDGANSEANGK